MSSQNQQPITTIHDGKLCDFIDGTIRKDTPEEFQELNMTPYEISTLLISTTTEEILLVQAVFALKLLNVDH